MTEGRRIHGEGVENWQDYIEERATYASDSNEYAEANRKLEQELADLQALHEERGRPDARPNIDALINEAQLRVDRMQQARGASEIEQRGDGEINYNSLTPEAEARNRVSRDISEGTDQSSVKP